MGYKHAPADLDAVKASLAMPNYLLKTFPMSTESHGAWDGIG